MNVIVCNDFSLHMINLDEVIAKFSRISLTHFKSILNENNYKSCIGDKDIASLFNLDYNPSNINLDENTRLLVVKPINGEISESMDYTKDFEYYDIIYLK